MIFLWTATLAVGVTLEVLLIGTLLRGSYREFRMLFVYALVLLVTTAAEASAFYNPAIYTTTSRYYWTIDAARQFLVFLLVLSFIYGGMERTSKRAVVRRMITAGAILFAVCSAYATRGPVLGRWMTELSRNLSFLAVVLNLILWAVLMKSRLPDRTLLMVSGGMGIQMTGKAIGHSLRQLSRSTIITGDLVIVLSHLLCLYIWWQAIREHDRRLRLNAA